MTVICCQAGMLMYGLITVIQHSTNRTDFRYTRIWHHTEKGWRILAGHCSAIA